MIWARGAVKVGGILERYASRDPSGETAGEPSEVVESGSSR
jgi:hypothetical protein